MGNILIIGKYEVWRINNFIIWEYILIIWRSKVKMGNAFFYDLSSSSPHPVVFVGGSRASSRYIPWYTRLQNGLIGQKAFSGRLNPLRTFCAFFKTFYPVTSDLWGKEVFCLDLACVARQQDGAPSLYSSPVPFLDLLSPSLLPALNSTSPQFHSSTVPPVYTAEGEITSACWSLKLLEAFWTESPPKLFEATSFWSFYQFQFQWKSWALVSSTWIQDPHAINWNMCLSAQFSSVYPNSSKCSLCELQILGRKLAEKQPTIPALLFALVTTPTYAAPSHASSLATSHYSVLQLHFQLQLLSSTATTQATVPVSESWWGPSHSRWRPCRFPPRYTSSLVSKKRNARNEETEIVKWICEP